MIKAGKAPLPGHVFSPMKRPVLLFASLLAASPLQADPPPAAAPAPAPAAPPAPAPAAPPREPANDLAKPLRKYDTNKDGKLTGEEMRLARQAFNRGGKAPEMSTDDWQGVLDYFKGDWRKRNFSKLDLNADGKLDDSEKERVQKIWNEISAQLTSTRTELVLKYDKNDDGNVTRDERRAFDPEFGRRRFEIEAEVLDKQAASEQAAAKEKNPETAPPAAAQSPAAPASAPAPPTPAPTAPAAAPAPAK